MTRLTCISPIDGSVFAEREALSLKAARAAAKDLRAAQPAWAALPLAERVRLVNAGVARLTAMDDAVVELAHMMGRPVRYGGEFSGVRERAEHMAAIAAEALLPTVVEDGPTFRRQIKRVPQGVALIIAPWNYPYLTAINTIVPALIAGNTVALKGATQTLLVAERIVGAFVDAGVPEDVFKNLFLDHDTTAALIGARAFDFVNFTGSVAGGRTVERAAAGTFATVGLELGGKDPGYVMEDADVAGAVATLMDGALFNAGQCCCGIERIYVHAARYDAFVEGAIAFAADLTLGNPLDPATTLGPMAHTRFAALVRGQVAEAVAAGAVAHLAPQAADDGGAYLSPNVLTGVDHTMRVMTEETFGPVVGIMKVASDEEALALMNQSDYGLTAAICTRDVERAEAFGDQLETGTVFMNRADYLDPALCWTGCKATGRGAALSPLGYHAVTRPKSFHLKRVSR
ncbi:MAG: aldehyde dehydrogenase family protein [Pseudomonadota bacterium]